MPSTDAAVFAERAKANDWNAVLSPGCFTEKGLADLGELIQAHGIEALDEAVSVLLAKSKVDRAIRRGHVKGWAYFKPYCEQIAKENVP